MASNRPAVRLLLVDDHPAIREGLAVLLSTAEVQVCGEAGSRAEARARVEETGPTLAVVDLSLGAEEGLALLAELRDRGLPAVVYSMHDEASRVEAAFAAGARGYVTKRESYEVLLQAIREVAGGGRFISPVAALALAQHVAASVAPTPERALSEQESQVYHLLGQGEGTLEIAAHLQVSARTVESYYARIREKLGLESMRDLRRHAIAHARKDTP